MIDYSIENLIVYYIEKESDFSENNFLYNYMSMIYKYKNYVLSCGIWVNTEGNDIFTYDLIYGENAVVREKDLIKRQYDISYSLRELLKDSGDIFFQNLITYYKFKINESIDSGDIESFKKYSQKYQILKMEGYVI